jgi:hypothetical protein
MVVLMNCKQGELAFVKKSIRPENTGLIITCKENLGYYLQGDKIEISGELWEAVVSDNYWLVESSSASITTLYGKSKEAFSPDLWLSPIRPEKLDEEHDEELTLTV